MRKVIRRICAISSATDNPRSHTATGVIRRRFRLDANGKAEILPPGQQPVKPKPPPNPKRLQSLQLANQARRKDRG